MSLFNLNEIDITESVLDKNQSSLGLGLEDKFAFNVFRFPIDIGAYDKGHYMVINIGQQLKTKYSTEDAGEMSVERNLTALQEDIEQPITAIGGVVKAGDSIVDSLVKYGYELNLAWENEANKIIPLTASSNNTGISKTRYKELTSQLRKPSFLRTVRKTTDTIALYMPDTLQFSYNQSYSDFQMNQGLLPIVGGLGEAGVSAVKDIVSGKDIKSIVSRLGNLAPFLVTKGLEKFGAIGTATAASIFGAVMNPQLELIYSSPEFRTFRFEFMMYPRSQKEALEVQRIIRRLKFHQAPELLQGGPAGLMLVPPSEFDISFYYNGKENPNIPKISTCVLTGIDTDYAPNGQFAAYEVPNNKGGTASEGGTGMPVGIRLSLTFKETQILTKFNHRKAYEESKNNIEEYNSIKDFFENGII